MAGRASKKIRDRFHGRMDDDHGDTGDDDGDSVPLPLLHFFFCFPAGACR